MKGASRIDLPFRTIDRVKEYVSFTKELTVRTAGALL
jgi:hypothetical protein